MRKIPLLLAAALGLAVLTPAASVAQADPSAAVRANVATLLADSQRAHDTLIADAQRLAASARSAKGLDRKQARAAVKADVAKLRSDRQQFAALLKADRDRLVASVKAAREAKAMKPLRSLVQEARASVKRQRAEVRAAIQEAKTALKELRASGR